MTPEELVKQLRLPDRIHIGGLMRDAADMIEELQGSRVNLYDEVERLRAELAELKSWMDDNDDSFVAELHGARAETSRLRIDHARAYANTVTLAKTCARLRAELADLNYHYECAVTDRDVANSELAEAYEVNRGALSEMCAAVAEADAAEARLSASVWREAQSQAAIARVRRLCELAIRDRDSGVGLEDIVNAIEGVQP